MRGAVPSAHGAPGGPGAPAVRGGARLWLLGAGMVGLACAFAASYPLRGNAGRLTDIGKLSGYRETAFAGYLAGVAAFFILYLLAFRECRRLPSGTAALPVFAVGAALVAAMAWMYPVNAIDVFIYSVRSRLLTEYGVDPLTVTPASYPDDPFMGFASREWSDDVSPYGPLWNLIAAPVTLLAGDRIGVAVAGFKVLAAVAALGGAWIVHAVVRARGGHAAAGALFFLWNPLVLWEGVGNGHNDLVMVAPVLLALLAWTRRHDRWVIPLLVGAALIKYVAVLLVPLAAVAIWRRSRARGERARVVGWSAGLTGLVALVGFFPFYDLGAVRESVERQGGIVLTSPAAVALSILVDRFPELRPLPWIKRVGAGLALAVLLRQAGRVARRPTLLPRAAYETLFAFLLFATWNFRGWYLIWLVGLAATLGPGWLAWRTVGWTGGALAVYGLFIWVWHWWRVDFATIQQIGVAVIVGPAVLLTLAEWGWGAPDRLAAEDLHPPAPSPEDPHPPTPSPASQERGGHGWE